MASNTIYVFPTMELRRSFWDIVQGDYAIEPYTESISLMMGGVRVGKVYADDELPSLGDSSDHVHISIDITDHLGSVSTVIDKSTGEVEERLTYQGYGAIESDFRGSRMRAYRSDYGFTGKEEDVEVGLLYFGARYLVTSLNRWASADPLAVHRLQADMNVYAYVHGQPLRATDPVGLDDKEEVNDDMVQKMLDEENRKFEPWEQIQRGMLAAEAAWNEYSGFKALALTVGRFFEGVWEGIRHGYEWRTLSLAEVKMVKDDFGDALSLKDVVRIRVREDETGRGGQFGYNILLPSYSEATSQNLNGDPVNIAVIKIYHEVDHVSQSRNAGKGDVYAGSYRVLDLRSQQLSGYASEQDFYDDGVIRTQGKRLQDLTVEQHANAVGHVLAGRHNPASFWGAALAQEQVQKVANPNAAGYAERLQDALLQIRRAAK